MKELNIIQDKVDDLGCKISIINSLCEVLLFYSQNLHSKDKEIFALIYTICEQIQEFKKEYNYFESLFYKKLNN